MKSVSLLFGLSIVALLSLLSCAVQNDKKYYMLNYVPTPVVANRTPFPCTVRLRDLDIEDAYARLQIVYRQNPFELQYYYSEQWAVKPTRMITDLIEKHIVAENLVSHLVRRYDDGPRPEFELSGAIESLEEYDSEKTWFAHLAIRLQLTRLSDGKVIYARRFDNRKEVFIDKPDFMVREMSAVLEHIVSSSITDLDSVLGREYGTNANPLPSAAE